MTYTVLHGEFVIRYPDIPQQGPQPDGDTVKFSPYSPALIDQLPRPSGGSPKLNSRGISVRLEGIDALETHFMHEHQELTLGLAARDAMLAHLGFTDVKYYDHLPYVVESANADRLEGWVLSNGIDAHGRLIGFCFPGAPPRADGLEIFAEEALIDQSANAIMLAQGLVYPAFYSTLPPQLRNHLADVSRKARADQLNVWAASVADPGKPATITSAEQLSDLVLWPKLYRRLLPYLASHTSLAGFATWLAEDSRDRNDTVLVLETGELRALSDILDVTADTIALTMWHEDFVIMPDGTTPTPGVPSVPQPRAADDVIVVAALPDPIGQDRGAETITLLNLSAHDVTLDGWQVATAPMEWLPGGERRGTKAQALTGALPAGGTLAVTLNRDNPLGNQGGSVVLRDGDGQLIDRGQYDKDAVVAGRTVLLTR